MTFTAFHFIAPNDLGPVAQAPQHQLWISVAGRRRQRPNDKSLDAQSFQLSAGNDDSCMDLWMKQKKKKKEKENLPASTWSFRRLKQSRRRRRAARFPYAINNGGKRGGRKKTTKKKQHTCERPSSRRLRAALINDFVPVMTARCTQWR